LELDPTLLPETTVTLPDGRLLGYVECGDPSGRPVFCFDGWPSSRWGALLKDGEAHTVGVRLIGVDRPGMGLSSFKSQYRILNWPADVATLAASLGLDRWAVWGISGGAPFALACAHLLPEQVSACGVVSGVAPIELALSSYSPAMRRRLALARRFPWLIHPLLWHATGRHYTKDLATGLAAFEAGLEQAAGPDRAFQGDPGNILNVHMLREAFRQGMRGPSYEGQLLVRDWGFRLEDVTHEHVHLWHGELDTVAPPQGAHAVAERIPNCEATFFADEGHASAVVHHTSAMLSTLAQW